MANEKNKNYLSAKEVKAIAKANAKEIKRLEAYKNRKAPEQEFLAEMKNPDNILEIEDLHTFFFTEQGVVKAVNGVSYDVPRHKVVGIVGESGCGKSVTSMSIMRLIQGPAGQIVSGSIRFQASDYKRDAHGDPVRNAEGASRMPPWASTCSSTNPVGTGRPGTRRSPPSTSIPRNRNTWKTIPGKAFFGFGPPRKAL